MASISINPEYNPGTLFTEITGNEKLKGITSDGRPINIGINLVLNKVEDKIDNVINESLDEKIDLEFGTIINEKIDGLIEDKLGEEVEKNFAGVNSAIEDIVDGTTPVAKANSLNTSKNIGIGGAVSSTPQVYTGANNVTIPIADVKEAYLRWGGKVIRGNLGTLDCAMKEDTSKNRLSFLDPDAIDIEYSNDGGNTWLEYNTSLNYTEDTYKAIKTKLVTTGFNQLVLSGGHTKTSSATIDDMLRITINATKIINGTAIQYFYFQITKIFINYQSSSAGKLNIEYLTNGDVDADDKILEGKGWRLLTQNTGIEVSGNSGWNSLYPYLSSYLFGGGQAAAIRRLRFSFYTTNEDNRTKGVRNIFIYGSNVWTATKGKIPLAKYGHMYDYNIEGNVTFPATVIAPSFEGIATSVVDGAISERKLGNSAVITEKIRDNNVTEEKLSTEVQAKLNANPLRPLFLAVGAVYNDTGADIVDAYDAPWGTVNGVLEKITHKAGCYYLNGLGDITEEEMMNIYKCGRFVSHSQYSGANCRTNIPTDYHGGGGQRLQTMDLIYNNKTIEVVKLSTANINYVGSLINFANSATNLKYVIGVLHLLSSNLVHSFSSASSLINIKFTNLGETNNVKSLSLANSPNISKESILHTIKNATIKVSSTITLHPDAYVRLESDQEIVDALKAKNENPGVADCTISLVSA